MNTKKNEIIFFTTDNKSGYKTRESWVKKNNPITYDKIKCFVRDNKLNLKTFKEEIYHYLFDVTETPKCLNCNKDLQFGRSLSENYGTYCSLSCTNTHEKHIENVKLTNNKKYGGNSPISSEEVKHKIQSTNIKKYGVENVFSDVNYIKEKVIQKYSIDHISKLDTTKNKIKKSNLKRYGVVTPLLLSKNRKKGLETRREIFLEKYGHDVIKNVDGSEITMLCNSCNNEFTINRNVLYHRNNSDVEFCTLCHPINSSVSHKEKDLISFIKSLGVDVILHDRTVLEGKELDILIPDKGISIEFNGLYWHTEKYVGKTYHTDKTKKCENKGIQLIHVFEDEWDFNKEIVKSRLKIKLGIVENKVFGRNCKIIPIDNQTKRKFLKDNHIQGSCGSSINIGLEYRGELVSIMTFGKRPFLNGYEYELVRFCNKLNTVVVGGASKLFKHFIKEYKPKNIVSYSDNRWGNGLVYKKMGFTLVNEGKPNYWYFKKEKREYRFKYRKDVLVSMGYDKDKTESQIMNELGFNKIYDCGSKKFIWGTIDFPKKN